MAQSEDMLSTPTKSAGASKENVPQYIKATKKDDIKVNALYPPTVSFLAADADGTLYFLAVDSAQLICVGPQGQTVIDLLENAQDEFGFYFDENTSYSKNYSMTTSFAYNEQTQQFFVCIYQPIHTERNCCVAAYDLEGRLSWKREGEEFFRCVPWGDGCAYVSGECLLIVDSNGDAVRQVQLPKENLVVEEVNDQLISLFENPFRYAFVEQAKMELMHDGQIVRESAGLCVSLDALVLSQSDIGTYLVGRDEKGSVNIYLQKHDGMLDLYKAIALPQERYFRPTATVSLENGYGVFVTEYTLDDTTESNTSDAVENDSRSGNFLLLLDDRFSFLGMMSFSLPEGQVVIRASPSSDGVEAYVTNDGTGQDHFVDRIVSMPQEYVALSSYFLSFR